MRDLIFAVMPEYSRGRATLLSARPGLDAISVQDMLTSEMKDQTGLLFDRWI